MSRIQKCERCGYSNSSSVFFCVHCQTLLNKDQSEEKNRYDEWIEKGCPNILSPQETNSEEIRHEYMPGLETSTVFFEETNSVDNWEEELLQLAEQHNNPNGDGKDVWLIDYENAKDFISKTIKQAEERERERIVKEIERYKYSTQVDGRFMKLTDIITLINQNNE
jgi:hypothetical protein